MSSETDAERFAQEELGMDTTRLWATHCQVHQSGPLTLMVFHETVNVFVTDEGGHETTKSVRKNVASILMTNENAETLGNILHDYFSKEKEDDGQ